jgi:hypothetical protein
MKVEGCKLGGIHFLDTVKLCQQQTATSKHLICGVSLNEYGHNQTQPVAEPLTKGKSNRLAHSLKETKAFSA